MLKIQLAAVMVSAVLSMTGQPQGHVEAQCAYIQTLQRTVIAEVHEQTALRLAEAKAAEEKRIRETAVTTPQAFKRAGTRKWNGYKWTWYSERALPGKGLKIPGRHTDADGFVCDEEEYICLASGSLKKGTVVDTPFGRKGKVYDAGCAATTLDVYTNW